MTPRRIACLATLAALAGCSFELPPVGSPEAPRPPALAAGACDTEAAQFALGKPFDPALADEMRTRSHAERVRAVRPGEMVTQDFDARRLTVALDAQGRVASARCG